MHGKTMDDVLTYFEVTETQSVAGNCMFEAVMGENLDAFREQIAIALCTFVPGEWTMEDIELFAEGLPARAYPDLNAIAAMSSVLRTAIVVYALDLNGRIKDVTEVQAVGDRVVCSSVMDVIPKCVIKDRNYKIRPIAILLKDNKNPANVHYVALELKDE